MSNSYLAQTTIGNITGIGLYGSTVTGNPTTAASQLSLLISNTIGIMTIIAGIYFLFQLILSGFRWIAAGGDKQVVQEAQKRISNSLIGLIVVVISYVFLGIVGFIFGVDFIGIGNVILSNIHP